MHFQTFKYPPHVARKLDTLLREASSKLPQLKRFVEVLFFASLLREEGHAITFHIAYPGIFDESHPTPERVHGYAPWRVTDFEAFATFDVTSVAKLAPLAGGDGEYLIVHCVNNELRISGVGYNRELPWFDFEHKLLTVQAVGAGVLRFFLWWERDPHIRFGSCCCTTVPMAVRVSPGGSG